MGPGHHRCRLCPVGRFLCAHWRSACTLLGSGPPPARPHVWHTRRQGHLHAVQPGLTHSMSMCHVCARASTGGDDSNGLGCGGAGDAGANLPSRHVCVRSIVRVCFIRCVLPHRLHTANRLPSHGAGWHGHWRGWQAPPQWWRRWRQSWRSLWTRCLDGARWTRWPASSTSLRRRMLRC